ncbi:PqqD family protein [Rothia sp. CCM 9417]|uniref:PqqD family protein n=1 Tax=Rothia sp. CCM 9417 TaxID=3402657 RepID=UPI003ADD90B2
MKEQTMRYSRANHIGFIMGFESGQSADDETYVANLLTSEISVLRGPSALIWEILDSPRSSEEIIADIQDIYGVPRETVADSVLNFLDSLVRQNLLELTA